MWTASHVLLEHVSIALPLYLCGCFKQPSRYLILTQNEFCGFYWCFETDPHSLHFRYESTDPPMTANHMSQVATSH